jgi:branched-chain amino acid transport system ATP-binding protein
VLRVSEVLLELRGLETRIGRYQILHGVDFVARRGRVTMLLGRNGAGKTTTLRTIMGLWRAAAGTITFEGKRIEALGTPEIASLGIAYVPETMGIFSQLTVRENLLLATGRGGLAPDRLDYLFALFPALKERYSVPAGVLSGGQKQMLAIGRAIIEPRRLLVVDEPTKGLAPYVIEVLIEVFRRLKQSETTILLVEQNFRMAASVGDDVAVMDDGHIVHTGSMVDLATDEALQHRLLGLSLAMHQ